MLAFLSWRHSSVSIWPLSGADPGEGGGGAPGVRATYFSPNLDFLKCKTGAPGGVRNKLDNGAPPPLLKIPGSAPVCPLG